MTHLLCPPPRASLSSSVTKMQIQPIFKTSITPGYFPPLGFSLINSLLNFTEILLNPMPIKNLRKKLQIKTEVIPMMSESEVCFVEERYYINPSI